MALTAKSIIRDLIIKGKTDEEIIEATIEQIPESAVDSKHCTKYRRELFNEGLIKAEFAALGSSDHKEWAMANLAKAKRGPHKAYWIGKEQQIKDEIAAEKAAARAAKTKTKAKAETPAPKRRRKKAATAEVA